MANDNRYNTQVALQLLHLRSHNIPVYEKTHTRYLHEKPPHQGLLGSGGLEKMRELQEGVCSLEPELSYTTADLVN